MNTLQITYMDEENPSIAVFNLEAVATWSITVLPRQGRRALQYKIDVSLLPQRVRDAEGALIDHVATSTYLFPTFEEAKAAIHVSTGNFDFKMAGITPATELLRHAAPVVVPKPDPVEVPVASFIDPNAPKPNPSKWVGNHSDSDRTPAVVIPSSIQPKQVDSPAKVHTSTTLGEPEKAPEKAPVQVIAPAPTIAKVKMFDPSMPINALGLTEWTKSCLVQKNLVTLRDLMSRKQTELTIAVGRKAALDIIHVLQGLGIELKP